MWSESNQLRRLRIKYFTKIENLFQVTKAIVVLIILTSHSFGWDYLDLQTVRDLAVFSMFFMYVDIFYWFKIIDRYAMVVRVLENTIKSVTIFMTLLILVVLMFTNIIYLLN